MNFSFCIPRLASGQSQSWLKLIRISSVSILSFVSFPAFAEVQFIRPEFFKKVTDINQYGELSFDGSEAYRLWGLDPDPRLLKEHVQGKFLACISVGSLEFLDPKEPRQSNVLFCTYGRPENFAAGLKALSKHLIREGAASEFCPESKGYFESCN